jgi:hypothetical protein
MESQEYEFSNSQNELIQHLADKMRFVGYFLIVLGAILTLVGLISLVKGGGVSAIVNGTIQLLIGFWTQKAAASFARIVKTQGNDMQNLMGALGELRKLYTLQYWLYIIAIVFTLIFVIMRFVVGVTSVGR